MTHHFDIYKNAAAQYDALVNAEDHQGNLLKEIQALIDLHDLDVVELGAGTGRVTRLLAPYIHQIKAFDQSEAMLNIARNHLQNQSNDLWELTVADHRTIPVETNWADLVISGWSFFYLVTLNWPNWQAPLNEGLNEVIRLLKPEGQMILIESLGTGYTQPQVPGPQLDAYYDYLENILGFKKSWIRTDYCFKHKQVALSVMEHFFGIDFATNTLQQVWNILNDGSITVPECTGLWIQSNSNLKKLV